MGLATKCGKTEKQRMSVEIYDILLAKVYVFPISIYSSSHDDIVKSSHISFVLCFKYERYYVSELVKNLEKQIFLIYYIKYIIFIYIANKL